MGRDCLEARSAVRYRLSVITCPFGTTLFGAIQMSSSPTLATVNSTSASVGKFGEAFVFLSHARCLIARLGRLLPFHTDQALVTYAIRCQHPVHVHEDDCFGPHVRECSVRLVREEALPAVVE